MKQSAFSRPPCRLIWYALVPLSLIFAFCFFLNGAIADEEPSLWETAVVSNPNPQDRLNLREQPSEAAASLGKYYNGVVVQIDQNLQNGWVHVTIGNGEGIAQGYMSTQYLAFGQDAQTVASAIPQYQSTSSQWSLRALPNDFGTELPIRYASGVQVELLGFTDEWWHMRVGDCTGYIRHNPAAFKQLSGYYYDGYRIGIVNNANPSARLNLRKEPKTSASSLGKYYNGCVVALLSDQSNGWIRVRIGNLEGLYESTLSFAECRNQQCRIRYANSNHSEFIWHWTQFARKSLEEFYNIRFVFQRNIGSSSGAIRKLVSRSG